MSGYVYGIIAAAIVAIIVCMIMRSSMKSVHRASSAANYIDPKDFKLLNKKDNFIDKTVTREKIERNNSNNSNNNNTRAGNNQRTGSRNTSGWEGKKR